MHATRAEREPMRPSRTLLLGVAAAAALVLIGLVVVLVQSRDDAPTTAQAPVAAESPEGTMNASAEEVAARFVEAYGAFDVERMMAYLADDAMIASLGAQDDPRLLSSWLEATGYRRPRLL